MLCLLSLLCCAVLCCVVFVVFVVVCCGVWRGVCVLCCVVRSVFCVLRSPARLLPLPMSASVVMRFPRSAPGTRLASMSFPGVNASLQATCNFFMIRFSSGSVLTFSDSTTVTDFSCFFLSIRQTKLASHELRYTRQSNADHLRTKATFNTDVHRV